MPLLYRIGWGIIIGLVVLFGASRGYPLVAEGHLIRGILIGLAYSGGAMGAILISFFLNQKLKGK